MLRSNCTFFCIKFGGVCVLLLHSDVYFYRKLRFAAGSFFLNKTHIFIFSFYFSQILVVFLLNFCSSSCTVISAVTYSHKYYLPFLILLLHCFKILYEMTMLFYTKNLLPMRILLFSLALENTKIEHAHFTMHIDTEYDSV